MTRVTIENRASEVANELDNHVFFFGGQLIEAGLASTVLDLSTAQALLDVGLKPLIGDLVEIARFLLPEKSTEEALLLLF